MDAEAPKEICPQFQPGPWAFTGECNWGQKQDRTCGYCGSMNPDDLMVRIEAGDVEIGPTDKNYKAYVRNSGGAPILQTFRDCPPGSGCKYDTNSQGKFYFQHLSPDQCRRFIELHNDKKLKIGYPGHFYVMPFFCQRVS